jgi:hypothetical protein
MALWFVASAHENGGVCVWPAHTLVTDSSK